MKTTLLNTASDISETITVYADNAKYSNVRTLVNEFGDIAFECDIELKHNYTPYDYETGEQYYFEVTDVDVTVLNVFDSEGDIISVNKVVRRQIEKILEQNLNFEIFKKY